MIIEIQICTMLETSLYRSQICIPYSLDSTFLVIMPELASLYICLYPTPKRDITPDRFFQWLLNYYQFIRRFREPLLPNGCVGHHQADSVLVVPRRPALGNIAPEIGESYVARTPYPHIPTGVAALARDVVSEKGPQVEVLDCTPCLGTVFSLECKFETEHRP